MWKVVKTKAKEVMLAEVKERGKKGGKEKKIRTERTEKRGKEKEKEKPRKKRIIEIKKLVEEWEIQDKDEEVVKSEAETRKLVPECFHKWIQVFEKKTSEWMPIRKLWNHAIDIKKRFVLKKRKVYPLSREEREEV